MKEPNWKPAFYASFLPEIINIAQEYGYAIGLHGSMNKDFDLIAVPWQKEVKPEYHLIVEVCQIVGGRVSKIQSFQKPHGRTAYMILVDGDLYIDISVFSPKK